MKVHVHITGHLQQRAGFSHIELDIPQGENPTVLTALRLVFPNLLTNSELMAEIESALVAVDGTAIFHREWFGTPLRDGSRLSIQPMLIGG